MQGYNSRDYAKLRCEEPMSIKQDQYTVIEYTRCEAAAIKTRARKMVDEKCKNTRLSAAVSSTCWLPLTPKSSQECSDNRV